MCVHSQQIKCFFFLWSSLFEAYSILSSNTLLYAPSQHQQFFPLRTMCYIINKICHTQRDDSKDSSALTSMNYVLYSVSACCIHDDVVLTITGRLFADVCMCQEHKENAYLCLCLFATVANRKWNLISHHHDYQLTFSFPQGCKWLKARDISVILWWFRNGSNVTTLDWLPQSKSADSLFVKVSLQDLEV